MQRQKNGHYYPVIDPSVCVECGLCQRTCPNNRESTFHYPIACYIATAVSDLEAKDSTSAGISSALERLIIQQGGVVYGCSGEECTNVKHIKISGEEDIYRLKGSKYVQSFIGNSFKQIKIDLQSGTKVLFVGTPCQVAGLYSYLGKTVFNLYTIDLVCHGVPSQQILNDALKEYLPNILFDGLDVRYRKKIKGKSVYGLFVTDKDGKSLLETRFPKNEYITGFLSGLYYRERCYRCQYAQEKRVSDITVGDYWDRENKVTIPNKKGGLSMLIVNTPKGKELIEKGRQLFHLKEGNYRAFVARNGQLKHPMPKNKAYDQFAEDYSKIGFLKAARKNLKDERKRIRKNEFINGIAAIIYAIPGAKSIKKMIRKNG